MILQDIVVDILLNEPTEEVKLSDGRDKRRLPTGLKLNTLSAAKWIKKTLGIRIQFTLVVEID